MPLFRKNTGRWKQNCQCRCKKPLVAKYYGNPGKCEIASGEEAEKIRKEIEKEDFKVSSIKKGERTKKPPLPFYNVYVAAGVCKTLEFSNEKDNADCPAVI